MTSWGPPRPGFTSSGPQNPLLEGPSPLPFGGLDSFLWCTLDPNRWPKDSCDTERGRCVDLSGGGSTAHSERETTRGTGRARGGGSPGPPIILLLLVPQVQSSPPWPLGS